MRYLVSNITVVLALLTIGGFSAVYGGESKDWPVWSVTQGWGELGMNTAVVPSDGKPARSITIGRQVYHQGLGTHAPSRIVFDLWGRYERFEAVAGIQEGNVSGSVIFQAVIDGRRVFDSGLVRHGDAPVPVSLSLRGAWQLELIVTAGGNGMHGDAANWADARFIKADSTTLQALLQSGLFDVAPFATVCTWDPANVSYHPNRVGELSVDEIFHETDLLPSADGSYRVPSASNGEKCIGLQWYENRKVRLLVVEFAPGSDIPNPNRSRVEWWIGESPWQGDWIKLSGDIKADRNKWVIAVNAEDSKLTREKVGKKGILSDPSKIRWIFGTSKPVTVKSLQAFTSSQSAAAKLMLECKTGGRGRVVMYNGQISEADGSTVLEKDWDLSQPLTIDVTYSTSQIKPRTDNTIVNITLPAGAFGVAVTDVIENGGVYVPDFGFYATLADKPLSLAQYMETKIKGRKTVLDRVRNMPDQSFERAMEKVHQPIQNQGPVMLSLACDNVKYIVERHGKTWYSDVIGGRKNKANGTFHFYPQFGVGKNLEFSRHLYGDWLPVPVHTFKEKGVVYEQRTFVAPASRQRAAAVSWLTPEPLFVSEFAVENKSGSHASARLSVAFRFSERDFADLETTAEGVLVYGKNSKLLAYVRASSLDSLQLHAEGGYVTVEGQLPAGAREHFAVYIPGWQAEQSELSGFDDSARLLAATEQYWTYMMSDSARIDLPSQLLENLIIASQVHCMLAARNEDGGRTISPWISSDRYGPLESEAQAVIHGMSLLGQEEFARRSLDYFINRYNSDGLLTTGYTLWGIGWHLWTLSDYYMIHRDSEWLESVAGKLEQACAWIVSEREKTKRLDASGEKVMGYGLMPPGVFADWNRFAYMVRPQGEFYAGLLGMAEAASDIGYPGGDALIENANEFRQELYRAYHWSQARSPVVKLSNGTWVPYSPTIIGSFGPAGEMFPGEDGGRAWGKDVSSGPHHLVPLKLLDDKREIDWISGYLEDNWFLKAGMGAYPLEEVEENWFDLGGFYKVQPYYARIAELYAYNDDVKPFIRAYFNAIPTLISKENLTFWEHFHNTGGWNKTHETGWFLAQTRLMLVMEKENRELWLAPFVTNHWMKDGMTVGIQNAQTRFGPLSYTIRSHVKEGFIEAQIDPPVRNSYDTMILRLRHPDGRPMRSVTVNGSAHTGFDPEREIVTIPATRQAITVRAEY